MESGSAQPHRLQLTTSKMGSPFTITVFATDTLKARSQLMQMLAYTDSLIKIFSDYDTSSELSQLSRYTTGQPLPVSSVMMDLLLKSQEAWRLSSGSFDVTAGSITRLWRNAMQQDSWPDAKALKQARRQSGFRHLSLLPMQQAIVFSRAGMMLNMGGIAKGYIAQKVLDSLKALGLLQVLVDAGGDMVAGLPPPGKPGWRIGIAAPDSHEELTESRLWLSEASVATSGKTYRFLEHKGRRYSHIINPRKGLGVTHHRQVTVVAKDGSLADWMATACSILPIAKARKLAGRLGAKLWIAEAQEACERWIVQPE